MIELSLQPLLYLTCNSPLTSFPNTLLQQLLSITSIVFKTFQNFLHCFLLQHYSSLPAFLTLSRCPQHFFKFSSNSSCSILPSSSFNFHCKHFHYLSLTMLPAWNLLQHFHQQFCRFRRFSQYSSFCGVFTRRAEHI